MIAEICIGSSFGILVGCSVGCSVVRLVVLLFGWLFFCSVGCSVVTGGFGMSEWSNLSLGRKTKKNIKYAEMHKCWIAEILKWCNTELLKCLNYEIMRCWNVEMLKSLWVPWLLSAAASPILRQSPTARQRQINSK